jgi:hypothetical protein
VIHPQGSGREKRQGSAKLTKEKAKYEKSNAPVPHKRGGSARPAQNSQGIIGGGTHGITSQVPPKNFHGESKDHSLNNTVKARRGESPMIKTNNLIASAGGGSSRKAKETPGSNREKAGGSMSTKEGNRQSPNYFRQSQVTFGGSKNPSTTKAESASFGAMMAKGPLSMSLMHKGSNITNASRGQIKAPQAFKAGPIRATEALSDMNGSRIERPKNERRNLHQPGSLKSGPLAQSKMPQRPGSSKPA